jgi:hypothetical protein
MLSTSFRESVIVSNFLIESGEGFDSAAKTGAARKMNRSTRYFDFGIICSFKEG